MSPSCLNCVIRVGLGDRPAAFNQDSTRTRHKLDLCQGTRHTSRVDRDRALDLLRGGARGIAQWNRWRKNAKPVPSLAHAHLVEFDLSDADLRGCDLQAAHLLRAVLFGAKLDDADLRGADLREAELSHVSLVRARLAEANLKKARLFFADLRQTKLERVKLDQVEAGANTRWPDGFSPAQHDVDPWPD